MLLIPSNLRGLKFLLIVGKSFLYCGKFYKFATDIFQKIIAYESCYRYACLNKDSI